MISLQLLVWSIVYLIVAGLIFGLLAWLVDYCCSTFQIQEPFRRVAKVVLAICAVLVVIGVLLNLVGYNVFRW